MFLSQISISNFKNLANKNFKLSPNINCFVGNNGVGKTNILDAIYYLSCCKSYFNNIDVQNILHGEDFFSIEGKYKNSEDTDIILCGFQRGNKKIVKRNGKKYTKLYQHIGKIPIVIISATDRDIIEKSEMRRKFIDSIICQLDKNYIDKLVRYKKILIQRNYLLKHFASNNVFNRDNLEIYNDQLSDLSFEIHIRRKSFLEDFLPLFKEIYENISGCDEKVEIEYQSQLNHKTADILFSESIGRDMETQSTSTGIHKDDWLFSIREFPVKKNASQGQQKSFLIALKIAELYFLEKTRNIKPILLIDDIFDKLDQVRIERIINLIKRDNFGQIFISDTHYQRTEEIVKKIDKEYYMFEM
ncbi:DNA replication/repair protein RecF [Ichthyobacterium seriolicida]|nr:DNA replication and repair protein RecF [Ichthyobacterium seriolicida]